METTTNRFEDGHTVETVDTPVIEPIKPIAKVKKCKVCGEILPLENFRLSKSGKHIDTCNKCICEARMAARQETIMAQRKRRCTMRCLTESNLARSYKSWAVQRNGLRREATRLCCVAR